MSYTSLSLSLPILLPRLSATIHTSREPTNTIWNSPGSLSRAKQVHATCMALCRLYRSVCARQITVVIEHRIVHEYTSFGISRLELLWISRPSRHIYRPRPACGFDAQHVDLYILFGFWQCFVSSPCPLSVTELMGRNTTSLPPHRHCIMYTGSKGIPCSSIIVVVVPCW
jgi:hypothetical protein